MSTYHGSGEYVRWTVEVSDDTSPHPSTSICSFGDDEHRARADYDNRSKYLHRGKTIRLRRIVRADAWVEHTDDVLTTTKPQTTTTPGRNAS